MWGDMGSMMETMMGANWGTDWNGPMGKGGWDGPFGGKGDWDMGKGGWDGGKGKGWDDGWDGGKGKGGWDDDWQNGKGGWGGKGGWEDEGSWGQDQGPPVHKSRTIILDAPENVYFS